MSQGHVGARSGIIQATIGVLFDCSRSGISHDVDAGPSVTPTCVSTQDRRFLLRPKPFFASQRTRAALETEEAWAERAFDQFPPWTARPSALVRTVAVIPKFQKTPPVAPIAWLEIPHAAVITAPGIRRAIGKAGIP